MLIIEAPAKINLVLEVLGKRQDGYHEIRSIMQTVSLCDRLSFRQVENLELSCTARELQTEENLVLKAARALKEASGYARGARIALDKQVPWEAGLGGGSSDAAAVLLGLNRLWLLDMGSKELVTIAAGVGSDVPFFMYGGTCEVGGRGEKVTTLPDMPETWFVILKPAMLGNPGKTGRLYSFLGKMHHSGGERCASVKAELQKGNRLDPALLYNAFDEVAMEAYPGLDGYWSKFEKAGAQHIHLAGSGPALFSMFNDEAEGQLIHDKLAAAGVQSYIVSTMGRDEIGRSE